MASVHDVAAYILQKQGPMSTWKLQKLVYYSQAWHLVWDDEELFAEPIKAWANGPVVPELYRTYRGKFKVAAPEKGDPTSLTQSEQDTIDSVLDFYGDKTGHWLSELTHQERPWQAAREGLSPGERGNNEITAESMAEYYSSL